MEQKTSKKVVYLAAPYTGTPGEEALRVAAVTAYAAQLMQQGVVVFSPLSHGHAVATYLPSDLKNSHDFWMEQCLPLISSCDELWVYCLPGWQTSKGVLQEQVHATSLGKSIRLIDPLTHKEAPL